MFQSVPAADNLLGWGNTMQYNASWMKGIWYEKAPGIGIPGILLHITTRMPGIWYLNALGMYHTWNTPPQYNKNARPLVWKGPRHVASRMPRIWYVRAQDMWHTWRNLDIFYTRLGIQQRRYVTCLGVILHNYSRLSKIWYGKAEGMSQPLGQSWLCHATTFITKLIIFTPISTSYPKQMVKLYPGITWFMITFINKS